MQVCKCLYMGLLALVLNVSVSTAIPNIYDAYDRFPSSQLLKAFSKSRSGKRAFPHEPPQYMLDLYNEVADSKGLTKSPLPHGASLVRAVPVQAVHDRRFSFPLENIPSEESILEAEVHIYHHQLNSNQRKLLGIQNLFKFNLFVVDNGGDTLLALSHTVGGHFSGWRMFSVGEAVKEARAKERRITFVVEATTMDGAPIEAKIQHGRHNANNPLLVLFNEISNQTEHRFYGPDLSLRKDRRGFSTSRRVTRSVGEPSLSSSATIPSGCELRSLNVDFEKIGWSWVVYPREYDACHCMGRCSFPLGQELNPTNHATVVSIVYFFYNEFEGLKNPSCVPTAYKNLALLYYDEEETVILKQFDRMVATQCGCR